MKRILCLWLPDWSVQRTFRTNAGPLALQWRDPRRGECIAACNRAANTAGVRPGQPLAEAQALLQRARRRGRLGRYDAASDVQALQTLAVHCERYSPCVGLGEAFPRPAGDPNPTFDSLLLDVTSIGALFGGEDQLVKTLHADFRSQGYSVRIAIADRAATAWALAHLGGNLSSIQAEGWPAIQELPIAALRLPDEQVAVLGELGIETVQQLAALPLEALATRFGDKLVRQLQRASGACEELITPIRPASEYQAEWLLEYPTTDRQALVMILEQLTQRVGAALRLRDHGALQLVCRLDIAASAPRLVTLGLFRPSANPQHFMELLRLQGEAWKLRGAVGRVGLSVLTTARLEHRQGQLFASASEPSSDELTALINRLSNRLGRERVTRPKLTRDLLPEKACELTPLTAIATATRTAPERSKLARRASQKILAEHQPAEPSAFSSPTRTRPLSLLREPVALQAISLAPEGPPLAFDYLGQSHRLLRHWGPERIETAWWRGPIVRRDYYRVEVTDGRRFWLFRELRGGQWFLHGHFD